MADVKWSEFATGSAISDSDITVGLQSADNVSWPFSAVTTFISGSLTSTGSGSFVKNTSPTFVTPILGVASATSLNKLAITAPSTGSTLTIVDGKTLTASNTLTFTGTDSSSVAFGAGGTVAYTSNNLSVFASTTSAQLAGVISDETGAGALVFANTPTLVTPILGTPTSGNLSNCTAYPVASLTGFGTGVATFLATPSSANLAAVLTDETGTGAAVFANTPTLVTPNIGAATGTSLNVSGTVTGSSFIGSVAGNRTLFNHFTNQGNTSTTETDLYSDTIAAGQLTANGDKLVFGYGGVFVSSGTATREVKIYFAGTVIFDSGALTLSLSSDWAVSATIIRVSATVIRYMASFTTEGAALSAYTSVGELTGLTLSGTNILKITGQASGIGAATNDIVAMLGNVNYLAAQ